MYSISKIFVVLVVQILFSQATFANQFRSSNYIIDESFIDNGGTSDTGSSNYQLDKSSTDITAASANSANFQTSGTSASTEPSLSFTINQANISFGDLSYMTTATAISTFRVVNYSSYGYVVMLSGNTPTNGNHSIAGINPKDVSQIGKEQYGINLVANTSPREFGANPDNHTGFGVGYAYASDNQDVTGYDKPNFFRYVSGEVVAKADKSSGPTDYTISHILNLEELSPGGNYVSNQTLICVGSY